MASKKKLEKRMMDIESFYPKRDAFEIKYTKGDDAVLKRDTACGSAQKGTLCAQKGTLSRSIPKRGLNIL